MSELPLRSTPAVAIPVRTFRRWTAFHVGACILLALAWVLDAPIFHACNLWYNGPKPPNGELHQLILSLAMFGQALGMVLSVVLVAVFDRKRERMWAVLLVLSATAVASSVGKTLVGRERPLQSRGATVVHGPTVGIASSRQQSFPSGHMTTSAALAAVLSAFYPQARALFWTLAVGVGVNRVVTVAHYPSDVIAGGWLGLTVASWMLGSTWFARCCAWRPTFSWVSPSNRATNLTTAAPSRAWSRRYVSLLASPWLLFAVSLSIHWLGNHATPLWDRDEPRFATAAREMLARNDWIVPTFNGDLRPDKPILVYWLTMSAYSVFGVNTFAARFFSGLAGLGAVAATYWLGRSMFDRRVGLVAGWVLALSPMLVVESKLATADALLVCLVTSATALMWRLANRAGGVRTALAFWFVVGLAILAKGPVALGVLATTAVGFSLIARDWRWLGERLLPHWGLLVVAVVVAPWCIAVHSATNGEFLKQALGRHVVERSFTALENHRGFPGYYLVSVFLLMAPWGWCIPWALVSLRDRLLVDRRLAFVLAWLIGPLLMFELVRTKLVHYYLPAYPAAALLLAAGWVGRFDGRPLGMTTIKPWLGWTTLWLGGGVALAVAVVGCNVYPQWLAVPGALSVGLLGVGLAAAGLALVRRKPKPAFRALVTCMAAGLAVACHTFLPTLGQSRPILEVARRLDRHRDARIAFWLYRDPSLIFNLGGVYPIVDPMKSTPNFDDARRLSAAGPFLCPMTPQQFDDMSADAELRLRIVESVTKWDGSTLKDRTVHLVSVANRRGAVAVKVDKTPQ